MSSLSNSAVGAIPQSSVSSSLNVKSSEHHKAILNRFSRIIGHIQKVKSMTEERKDLEQILVQLSAVKSALSGLSRALVTELVTQRLSSHDSSAQASDVQLAVDLIERYVK